VSAIPEGAELEFAVYKPTGTVHIHEDCPAPYVHAPVSEMSFSEGLMAMWTTPQRFICGARFRATPGLSSPGEWVDCFEDDAICIRCVRALGDQSPRAFEHPRPGDGDA
jgi:hypothetical protein